ncbi:MAG: radical SAM family heme chaperone HemW [Acidimicrobiia bacterium]|nr:radical SAM family heme chaperone HemW [Acidimicrobiia bacterium]
MISPASAAAVEAAAALRTAYVHIPFCGRVCPYCDFTVVAGRDDLADRYLAALVSEIESVIPWGPLDAVFIGGGTPSRFGPDRIERVIAALADHHGLRDAAEVTMEANPEDIDPGSAQAFHRSGVTRLSVGVQSFDDEVLVSLGRTHDSHRARAGVEAGLAAGFESVSIDLIYGTPNETDRSWEHTLRTALDIRPPHISAYSLTVEPGTVLWKEVRRGAPEPDPDVQADRWELTEQVLGDAGYERYEVSNHALPGHHCRYNAAVWAHAEYLAFGVGAHGYRDGVRTANVRRLDTYLARVSQGIGPVQSSDLVTGWAAEQERLLVGLRRAGGVVPGAGGTELLASDRGRRLLELGVIEVDGERLVVRRPLLTDEVLRAVLELDPPA